VVNADKCNAVPAYVQLNNPLSFSLAISLKLIIIDVMILYLFANLLRLMHFSSLGWSDIGELLFY
jgi:hypothetical protein